MSEVRLLTRGLLRELQRLGETADTIYIVTAFFMRSGVRELLSMLFETAVVQFMDLFLSPSSPTVNAMQICR